MSCSVSEILLIGSGLGLTRIPSLARGLETLGTNDALFQVGRRLIVGEVGDAKGVSSSSKTSIKSRGCLSLVTRSDQYREETYEEASLAVTCPFP